MPTDRHRWACRCSWCGGLWRICSPLRRGVRSLGAFRFALGLGEAGVWPAASKAVSEWFPAKERALAIGLYTMGATLGATLAPYVVIPLATAVAGNAWPAATGWLGTGAGWRLAFLLTGLAGLVWLAPRLGLTDSRARRWLRRTSGRWSSARGRGPYSQSADGKRDWGGFAVPRTCCCWRALITDPVWYFLSVLVPKNSAPTASFETPHDHVDRLSRRGVEPSGGCLRAA
jgi:ACS family hexuronate transporter-like MFS transporter